MIEYNDIKIEADRFQVSVTRTGMVIDALLKDHVDAVANEVQAKARELAPRGPTGRLKAEGVIRDSKNVISGGDGLPAGSEVTNIPSFGGGRAVRGPGGRFVAASSLDPGHTFSGGLKNHTYVATVELNPALKHAKWVHEGTGLYGPYHSPIVPRRATYLVFYWHGRHWQKRSVRGQRAQPFLTESFEYVRSAYEPAKLSELRAEINAVT